MELREVVGHLGSKGLLPAKAAARVSDVCDGAWSSSSSTGGWTDTDVHISVLCASAGSVRRAGLRVPAA